AGLASHRHIAAHHACELAGDGEAKPGAAETLSGCGIGLAELLEQLCLLLCGHADAGVGYSELDEVAAIAHPARPSFTSPAFVNLQALLRRLRRICRSRIGPTVNPPRLSWASMTRRFLFCSASCPAVPTTSFISDVNCPVCGLSSSFPASIFERSRTWLMRPSR